MSILWHFDSTVLQFLKSLSPMRKDSGYLYHPLSSIVEFVTVNSWFRSLYSQNSTFWSPWDGKWGYWLPPMWMMVFPWTRERNQNLLKRILVFEGYPKYNVKRDDRTLPQIWILENPVYGKGPTKSPKLMTISKTIPCIVSILRHQ